MSRRADGRWLKINLRDGRFFWPLFLTVPLALFVPQQVLSESPLLQLHVDLLRLLIPNIEALAAASQFPDVTRFVLSVAYSLVPVQVGLHWRSVRINREALRDKWGKTALLLIVFVIMFIMLVAAEAIWPRANEPVTRSDYLLRDIAQSRLWLGIVAGVGCTVTAVLTAAIIALFRHCLTLKEATRS